jgi:cell shape-determining protein MreD
LWFDSLSANPVGISIFPLFLVGFVIHRFHGLLLREQFSAQVAFGAVASFVKPGLTVLILLSDERNPLIGWGTLWQFVVMTLVGGLLTPVCFWILDRVNGALSYQPIAQTAFRSDREIKRGRG